jgi:hypothetical protein
MNKIEHYTLIHVFVHACIVSLLNVFMAGKIRLRHLQTSDVLHLASPIGMYYIYMTDMHKRYKKVFMHCLYWLYCVKARVISRYWLGSNECSYTYKKYWQENAAALEYLMPINFFNCNEHILQHTVDELLHTGPVYNTHMEPFEASAKYLKSMVTSSPVPEETIAKQISFEWASMLQRYENYTNEEIQTVISPSIRRGTYPPVINVCQPLKPYKGISADDWKALVRHFIENDPYLQAIQIEMQLQYPRTRSDPNNSKKKIVIKNNWTTMSLLEFNATPQHLININARLQHKNLNPITINQLNHIKQGPDVHSLKVCTKVLLNNSEFRSLDDQTANTDYSGIKYINSDNEYQYASIRRMFVIKPHIYAAEQVIFHVNTYIADNDENYTIEILQRASDIAVARSSTFTPYISACYCLDENIAFWPKTGQQHVCPIYIRSLDMYNYRQ